MTRRREKGFSLIEMMAVVAILAITSMFAIPAWQGMQADNRLKSAARVVANAFELARSQAILVESVHIVFWSAAGAVDACGNALPAPVVILDDTNTNCCIDPAERVVPFPDDPGREFNGLNWGVTFAPVPVPQDPGGGNFATGSSFSDQFGNQTQWVAFRPDGVPVGFTAACNPGQVGTGAGGVYLTNAASAGASGRDYAVVLSPLGSTRVHTFDRAAALWTN